MQNENLQDDTHAEKQQNENVQYPDFDFKHLTIPCLCRSTASLKKCIVITRGPSASLYDTVCKTSGHFELYRCRYGRAKCSLDSVPPKGKPRKSEPCVRHTDH
eukprot:scaffold5281_cov277-Pinguiococcus_pyrenoidosus.AAC.1